MMAVWSLSPVGWNAAKLIGNYLWGYETAASGGPFVLKGFI